VAGPLPAAITLLAPLILVAYGLSRERHQAILATLETRRMTAP
jgi:Na+/melibiose symporter-like transporter